MNGDGSSMHGTSGLERCPACLQAFVEPVALLDLVDEGLYLIALECKNCGRLAVGQHEDAELELAERFRARAAQQIASAIELVEVSRLIDELDSFTVPHARDAVLPEDF
jgi:hypothetical protein